jgi:hypothetical protein
MTLVMSQLVVLVVVVLGVLESLLLLAALLELLIQAEVEVVRLATLLLTQAATAAPVWLSSKCQIPLLQPSQVV